MTSHKETPSSLVFPASLRRWTRRIQANVALSLVAIPVSCCLRGRSRPVWNENPNPFVWTATVDSIVAKLARCRQTLEKIQPRCTRVRTTKRHKKRLSS